VVVVSFNHSGSADAVERDTAGLRRGPEPLSATVVSEPYLEVQTAHDLVLGWGHRSFIAGLYANDFRADAIDALVRFMRFIVGHREDQGIRLVRESGQQVERRSNTVADHQDQFASFEPGRRLIGIADEDEVEAFLPQAFESLIQRCRYALDENDDRRCSGGGGAADLIFDERSAGERKQSGETAGIIFLISSDQSAERQTPPPPTIRRQHPRMQRRTASVTAFAPGQR
jgi:hypothetical protein